jgi:N6-adenosine-specific RNA methylase IME4
MSYTIYDITTTFYNCTNVQEWKEPFNQATFINYDPVNPILINSLPIPPAQTIGGVIYPTSFKINLNVGEVNRTNFNIDIRGSQTALCWIVYTQYIGIEQSM